MPPRHPLSFLARAGAIAAALLAGAVHALSLAPTGGGPPMSSFFDRFETAEQAKAAIATALPKGSSRRAAEEWLAQSGIQCFPSALRDPYIACRYIAPSKNMVHVVWNLGLFFTEQRELERIEVSKGMAGP
jgi:hypothetical protein